MPDQYYRLEESWNLGEWPFEATIEEIERLNEVAPGQYSFVLWAYGGEERVELYEYVGEYDGVTEDDTDA